MLVVGLALVAFAVAGVAVDGTRAWLARRTLQNAADSSSLAGASELDRRAYYTSSGTEIVLEPATARAVAAEWLARRGLDARASISADTTSVEVVLRDELATTFLGLVGIKSIPVAAQATAEPVG
ncbi:hypothetical protein BH24ACT26_BH24ACT26_19770 [soil metagenome]